MSQDVYRIFTSVAQQAKNLMVDWETFRAEISQKLPASYQTELQELDFQLIAAAESLYHELEHPTLILATTGTTSSGKSTLVNLLCGAEILPVAVQEKSAGVVIVEYSQEKKLKIEATEGATWECGTWENLTDDKIYALLDQVMEGYLTSKEEGRTGVDCPQSTIYYPFRLKSKSGLLDVPEGTTVKIMDLPGLAHVGDSGNAEVIDQCRDALCLVTYNSAEIDRKKTNSLLQQVVNQVKELSGSPDRMLFVLNRIDVFRTSDKDWETTEQDFVRKTKKDIKEKLKEYLPEYSNDIETIETVKLSALPALLSLKLRNEATKDEAAETLDKTFGKLIPDEIIEELPRKVERWENHDCHRVADAVWQEAYADQFHQALNQHIQQHFPQLIIPQIIQRFKEFAGSEMARWSVGTTHAILNSSKENYERESQKLEIIRTRLNELTQRRAKELVDFLGGIQKASREEKTLEKIDEFVSQFIISDISGKEMSSEDKKKFKTTLIPLYDWARAVGEGIEQIFKPVLDSLERGTVSLDSEVFTILDLKHKLLLEECIKDLNSLGYKDKAGREIEAHDEPEQTALEKLNSKLNALSTVLQLVVNEIVEKIIAREMKRVRGAVESLFKSQLNLTEEEAKEIVGERLAIDFPESQLINVDLISKVSFSFEAGFPITAGTYTVSKQEKVGTRLDWAWNSDRSKWWSWMTLDLVREKDIYATKYETRSSKNANIPSMDELLKGWFAQRAKGELEVTKQVIRWLLEQITQFNKGVNDFQKSVIEKSQAELGRAHREIDLDFKTQKRIWEPLSQKAQGVAKNLDRLGKGQDEAVEPTSVE